MTEEEIRRADRCGTAMVAVLNEHQLRPRVALCVCVDLALSTIAAGPGAGHDLSGLVFELATKMLAEAGIKVIREAPPAQVGVVQ